MRSESLTLVTCAEPIGREDVKRLRDGMGFGMWRVAICRHILSDIAGDPVFSARWPKRDANDISTWDTPHIIGAYFGVEIALVGCDS